MPARPDATFWSRRSARRAGIALDELLGHQYTKLFFDCYVSASIPVTTELLITGAMSCWPSALGACHHTAAQLWDAVVPNTSHVHLAIPAGHRTKRVGIRTHLYGESPQLVRRRGVWTTTAEQTFIDLSESLDLVDLVILGDSLIRKGHVTAASLRSIAADGTGRGCRVARQATDLTRAGVDSPNETRTRLLLVLAGLPEPNINIAIRDHDGVVLRRIDLAYEDAKLAIEYDGRHHVAREDQWEKDLRRREELEASGWRFVVLTADDLYSHPDRALDRVSAAMRAQGMRVPRQRQSWRTYFMTKPTHRAA